MKSQEEKRMERLQQFLLAESRGDAPMHMGSQRTLFGIKSQVEQVIERTAAEDAARCAAYAKQRVQDGALENPTEND